MHLKHLFLVMLLFFDSFDLNGYSIAMLVCFVAFYFGSNMLMYIAYVYVKHLPYNF